MNALHTLTGYKQVAVLILCLGFSSTVAAEDFPLPGGLVTYDDGRQDIVALYHQYLLLKEAGWQLDIVSQSQPAGRDYALPIIALRTPQEGEAVWILSGVHGEETAGPNAIAASIDALRELGEHRAVVVLPLNNPHGYANNWRYLNVAVYDAAVDGQSVGDSSHLLIDPENPEAARAAAASSPEADAITAYILAMSKRYPPIVSLDLHEDNLIDQGYVYSQGKLGAADPLASLAVQVLAEHGIPLKMSGTTRFDEPISQGIIGPVIDSSVDELISASSVIVNGEVLPGPNADTVLVFETPAAALALQQRVQAHVALLQQLAHELTAK
ncbi:MAG: hypothetical protein SH820_14150 [Xanthomonadales bacterium]|nr:hypothetical protein [Xanthomonadales bacterium]